MAARGVWDPDLYHRYGELRLRPALELLMRVTVQAPALIHDIGTGGGAVARLLAERWPKARVIGSDSSPEMLTTAALPASTVEWQMLDLEDWAPRPEHDLIYGNAVLHWVRNHEELFPRLVGGLVAGGELAVQMPLSWYQPSHQVLRDTLASLPSAAAAEMSEVMSEPNVAQPDVYYEILRPHVASLDIWTTEYQQELAGDDPVLEWMSGSILRPVLAALSPAELELFRDRCTAALREAYPRRADGVTLFPFRRLFVVARR